MQNQIQVFEHSEFGKLEMLTIDGKPFFPATECAKILGYSNTNGFSVDNMPDNLKWWLGEYAKQIEYAIENNIKPTDEIKQQWGNYLNVDKR